MEEENNSTEKINSGGGDNKKNALEWTVFGFGLLVTCFVLGFIIYQMVTFKESPPELEASYMPDPSSAMPNRLKIKVSNKSDNTAEHVIVEAALMKNDSAIETAELNFEFLPNRSYREGWLSFNKNPATADSVSLRIVSFRKP